MRFQSSHHQVQQLFHATRGHWLQTPFLSDGLPSTGSLGSAGCSADSFFEPGNCKLFYRLLRILKQFSAQVSTHRCVNECVHKPVALLNKLYTPKTVHTDTPTHREKMACGHHLTWKITRTNIFPVKVALNAGNNKTIKRRKENLVQLGK